MKPGSDAHLMLDEGLLNIAAERCGSSIRFVDIIELTHGGMTKRCVFCVGTRHLFFLKRTSLEKLLPPLHVGLIARIDIDAQSDTLLRLTLEAKKPVEYKAFLDILAFQRVLLLKFLSVSWRSDYALRFGRIKDPLVATVAISGREEKPYRVLPNVLPFKGYQNCESEGYRFFLRKGFRPTATLARTKDSGLYSDARGIEVAVTVYDAVPETFLRMVGREGIKSAAAEIRRSLTRGTHQHQKWIDNVYYKRMNLTDDTAVWEAWELLYLRMEYVHHVIVLQRKHGGALLHTAQEIHVTFKVSNANMVEWEVTTDDLATECRLCADSLRPASSTQPFYPDFFQCKLDALQVELPTIEWLHYQMNLRPSIYVACLQLFKSLLQLLDKHGQLQDRYLLHSVYKHPVTEENPVNILNRIVRNPEGISNDQSPEQLRLQHQWQHRCAGYITLILNGLGSGNEFNLADVAAAAGKLGSSGNKIVHYILDFLLHARPADWTKPWEPGFKEVVGRNESVSCNDPAIATLLNCAYIGTLYEADEATAYVKFIAALLRSPSTSTQLKSALCSQMVRVLSSEDRVVDEKNDQYLVNMVPALVSLIRPSESLSLSGSTVTQQCGSSAFIATVAATACVNLSCGNAKVKSILTRAGVATAIVHQLQTGGTDARKFFLKLAINISKTSSQRMRLLDAGALVVLCDVLMEEYDSPHPETLEFVYEIAALIGHLANEPTAREFIINKTAAVECLLYAFHNAKPLTIGRSHVIFALKQLGLHNWQIRQRLGYHMIGSVLNEIRFTTFSSNLEALLQSLNLLVLLTGFKVNCNEMKNWNYVTALEAAKQGTSSTFAFEKIQQIEANVARALKVLESLS